MKVFNYNMQANKLPYIDALRGLAVCSVWIVHTGQLVDGLPQHFKELTSGGARGVQLFFVISSFTLLLSWSNRKQFEKRVILNFFIRRFFRIAPLFYIAMLFYGYLSFSNGNPPEYLKILMTATFTNGLIPNLSQGVVLGGWTVAAEMLFYFIFPVLAIYINKFKRAIFLTWITLLISILVYFLGRQYPVYYWLPTQLPIFSLGFVLFYLKDLEKNTSLEICAVLILIGILLQNTSLTDFAYACFFAVLTFVLSIYPVKMLVNGFWCYLGTVSFSGYLTHFAFLPYTKSVIKLLPNIAFVQFIIALTIVFICSTTLSTLTYRFIEIPGVSLGKILISKMEKLGRVRSI